MIREPEQTSDELLFIRYIRGDGDAFREIMDRYAIKLLRYCRGYSSSEADAEDLVQDTFLRVIKSAPTYRATSRFSTWIYTIARNLAYDRLAQEGNRERLMASRRGELAVSTDTQPIDDQVDDLADSVTALLQCAMTRLTALEAETVRLTFQEGWSTTRIAELQECARSTVRVRRFQALNKIRQVAGDELREYLSQQKEQQDA